jgi:hypothetical protein
VQKLIVILIHELDTFPANANAGTHASQ